MPRYTHIPELIDTPDGPMTRGEAAKHYRINKNTLIRRIWSGWPPERWFEAPYKTASRPPSQRKGRFITPYGRMSILEIADHLGMDYATLRYRLYVACWSDEEALNTPLYGQRGKQFILPPDEYARRRAQVLESDYKERLNRERQRRLRYNKNRKAKRLREKADARSDSV